MLHIYTSFFTPVHHIIYYIYFSSYNSISYYYTIYTLHYTPIKLTAAPTFHRLVSERSSLGFPTESGWLPLWKLTMKNLHNGHVSYYLINFWPSEFSTVEFSGISSPHWTIGDGALGWHFLRSNDPSQTNQGNKTIGEILSRIFLSKYQW